MLEPRLPSPTVNFVDEYCAAYQTLFPQVRSFEAFKHLHLGMISDIKRKSLPAIAKVVGLNNEQSLHHFLTESPWRATDLMAERIRIILEMLGGREIVIIIDDTGDRKKGKKTAYVKRQYIGNLGKVENGIVAVTAYGVFEGITFPLIAEVYKPLERLKKGDHYRSKPQIAAGIVGKLKEFGINFNLVLADSSYGESESNFIKVLEELELNFVVAIRSNHVVWLQPGERARWNKWRKFDRVFSDGRTELRWIQEIIFGRRGSIQYWTITTEPTTLPANSTWYIMTKVAGIKYKQVGNLYGLRNWVEYGLKQSKDELGWADFRMTDYAQIQKWWEVVMSAYLMVSLHANPLNPAPTSKPHGSINPMIKRFDSHLMWDKGSGWKNILNNLRLVIQPFILFNLIKPWLEVFPIPHLSLGFSRLISLMNHFPGAIPTATSGRVFLFSSA
jgi:SRSO17 transposase